jgi:hypothetical protein
MFEGYILRMRNARGRTALSDATCVHNHQADVYRHGGKSHLAYIGGHRECTCRFEGPNFRMPSAMQSGAASHSAYLAKHQKRITIHGERVKTGNL